MKSLQAGFMCFAHSERHLYDNPMAHITPPNVRKGDGATGTTKTVKEALSGCDPTAALLVPVSRWQVAGTSVYKHT